MIPAQRGLYATRELRAAGMDKHSLAMAVETGALWHVHRGWYAVPGTDAEAIRAMRLGGRLGCVSALRLHGAWVPPDQGLHLAMPPHASGRRSLGVEPSDGITRHWHTATGHQTFDRGISPLPLALALVALCQPEAATVAVFDSVLHRRLMTLSAVEGVIQRLPRSRQGMLRLLDGRSEEGIESLARAALVRAGFSVEPQVVIEGVGRVDLLVDGWLVVELDGRETHAQERAFATDRRRAAALVARGFQVVSFTYADCVYGLDRLVETVRRIATQHSVPAPSHFRSAGRSAEDRMKRGS